MWRAGYYGIHRKVNFETRVVDVNNQYPRKVRCAKGVKSMWKHQESYK